MNHTGFEREDVALPIRRRMNMASCGNEVLYTVVVTFVMVAMMI